MQRSYAADLERGYRNPSVRTLVKVANALGVLPSVLLEDDAKAKAGASYVQDDTVQGLFRQLGGFALPAWKASDDKRCNAHCKKRVTLGERLQRPERPIDCVIVVLWGFFASPNKCELFWGTRS